MPANEETFETPTKLQKQIRFALDEMGELNAHHEFEHLARAVAKARVASNLLPATGPVSGGGDQGKDFETFATFISSGDFEPSAFAALTTNERLAFVCTLQAESLSTKVLSDVNKIMSQGERVDRVYAFLGEPLSVAKRNKLKATVREEHEVQLEVFDRHALAEFLSEHDLYWVAVEYLHMSASMQPPPPLREGEELPTWYASERDRWLLDEKAAPPETFADLEALRSALNFSLFNQEARNDVTLWAQKIQILNDSAIDKVRQIARYSVAVARYRGGAEVDGDAAAMNFFAELHEIYDPGLLEDFGVLLNYTFTAIRIGLSGIAMQDAEEWRAGLIERCLALKDSSPGPNNTAALLRPAALQCLSVDTAQLPQAEHANGPEYIVTPAAHGRDIDLGDIDVTLFPLYDVARGMTLLRELVQILPRTPLFPVESVAETFDFITPILVDHPDFEEVRERLDEAVAQNAGQVAAARRARDRGMRLLRAGRQLEALREIHVAKSKWWTSQTLEGSAISLLVLSRIYYGLRLLWAAKMYALAASAVAINSGKSELMYIVPRGVLMAAECEANGGAWLSSAATMRSAIHFQAELAPDPWNSSRHEFYANALRSHLAIFRYTLSSQPLLHAHLRNEYGEAGMLDALEEMVASDLELDETFSYDFLHSMMENFSARALSDGGAERSANWSCRGVEWTVRWENEEQTEALADRFVSVTQVLLAEIGKRDNLPLIRKVHVSVFERGRNENPVELVTVDADGTGYWEVRLDQYTYDPASMSNQYVRLASDAVGAAFHIVSSISALSSDDLNELFTEILNGGLTDKIFVGRPNDELISYKDASHWPRLRQFDATLIIDCRGTENPALPSFTTPGPGYSEDAALERIELRYSNTRRIFRYTLARVLGNSKSRKVLRDLRLNGWLDWHLLTAIANITWNYRISRGQIDPESDSGFVQQEESGHEIALPLHLINAESMRTALEVSAVDALRGWRLDVNVEEFPGHAVLDLLKERYEFDMDIDHEVLVLD